MNRKTDCQLQESPRTKHGCYSATGKQYVFLPTFAQTAPHGLPAPVVGILDLIRSLGGLYVWIGDLYIRE